MTRTIGLDVYGTLVDPLAMREPLATVVGPELADQAAALWRSTQIEYAFRRTIMAAYASFGVCTRQALEYTLSTLRVDASPSQQDALIDAYLRLPVFSDVAGALAKMRVSGYKLVAFSNGTEAAVRMVLGNGGILDLLDDVVSVDDLRVFKPSPAVYDYLVRRGGQPPEQTWLVSANAWDVIGAKHAGLRAAWLRRRPDAVFDPWGIEPDLVASDLADFVRQFGSLSS